MWLCTTPSASPGGLGAQCCRRSTPSATRLLRQRRPGAGSCCSQVRVVLEGGVTPVLGLRGLASEVPVGMRPGAGVVL